MRSKKIKQLSLYGIFLAILILMTFTPLGFLPLGVIRVTLLQIPVIVASICFGRSFGVKIGLMFGILSVIYNTLVPNATSFVFTPFFSMGGITGGWQSLIIAIVPRMMIAVSANTVYNFFKKKNNIAIMCSAVIGSLTNTVLVLLGIYVFFGSSYAQAINVNQDILLSLLSGVVGFNGVIEAIASAIFTLALVRMLKKARIA